MRTLRRAIVGVTLAPFLVLGPGFAQEHVHPADADHPHAVMHRHVEPHHHGSAHPSAGASITDDDDDGRAIWVNATLIGRGAFKVRGPVALLGTKAAFFTFVSSWANTPHDDACPTHGPPYPIGTLRGPPSLPA